MATIQVTNTTLFHVAARYLNDATQWYRIAALNGIDDPVIATVTQIMLPVADPSLTGGLPSQ